MFPQQPTPSEWRPEQTPTPHVHRPTRGRGLAATVVGVALFGALIGVAADRWAVSNLGSTPLGSIVPTITTGPKVGPVAAPNGTTAQAAPTATLSSDPTQAAVQQVIQHGDDEQAQAFANNDPTA